MPKTGLDALLRPEDSILVLIDHQPFQFANLHSHEPTMILNNVIGLAKAAKVFNVPTILTTVIEERGGHLIKGLQDVFPEQKPIGRTTLNTWEDPNVTDIVQKTGRKQLVLAALYTEICLAMPAMHALAEGYDVFIVTDASGGVTAEAHDMPCAAWLPPVRCRSPGLPCWLNGSVIGRARKRLPAWLASFSNMAEPAVSPWLGNCSFSPGAPEPVSEGCGMSITSAHPHASRRGRMGRGFHPAKGVQRHGISLAG